MIMQGVVPKGEGLRSAIRWLSDNAPCTLARIDEASRRFDLSPLEEDFLLRYFRSRDGESKEQQPGE